MFDKKGSLGEAIRAGRRPAVLIFSGQDPDWARSLQRTLSRFPGVRGWTEDVLAALGERLAAAPGAVPELAGAGIDPLDWLQRPQDAFDPAVRAGATHCFIGTSLGHLSACRALAEAGVLDDLSGFEAIAGHSIGLLSAWAVARDGLRLPVPAAVDALFACAVFAEISARHHASIGTADLAGVLQGDSSRVAMLAVAGPTETRLRTLLAALPESSVEIALQNSWDRFVLGGAPDDLHAVAEHLAGESGISTEGVPSSAPFHHRILEDCVAPSITSLRRHGVHFEGSLQVPLVDSRDGSAHAGGDLTAHLVESMFARPVRWADTIAELASRPGAVVIDVGPSTLTSAMTRRTLQGSGATVVALGSDEGLKELIDEDRLPAALADWSHHMPAVVPAGSTDHGAHRVVTRHTRRTQRSAFVLAGMNPTTVDAGIVVAAANAGHVAELGGGGQVSATIFSERMTELAESLEAGHEVTFNALNLDPYLWDLHIGRDRMVQRARAAGAPVCGVTVSAGIPETDEAVALLEELHELGIWLNAFKPGTIDQVRAVLRIAQRCQTDVWLHMEGGRAGGHHSWVELEDLLFATYPEIRRCDNVVLCVGGGVGTPERAAELLSGSWSLRHSAHRMPVDAVLLGTVAMATRESTASASVKAALVAAPGTDELVRTGEWRGGVTSARSSLGADIHCLDSHAARVADLLEEVAGDAEAVAARHDEIAAALAGTAKPWFGDLARMTYAQMLERFVELCARGRHGRYEDGRWFDHTHRGRFLDLLRRAEARCCEMDEGTVGSLFSGPHDLDDPGKAIALLRDRHPLVERAELEPTDVAYFAEVCDAPGKPVPFVAVIDSEVRRRYLVDSLWQSHSDLWSFDEVLVIPGPVALAGITRADEPVADLLDRFDREVAEHLRVEAACPVEVIEQPSSVELLLDLSTIRDGDQWTRSPIAFLADREAWELSATSEGAEARLRLGSETARLRGPAAPSGEVEVEIAWPALTDLDDDGSLRFTVIVGMDHAVPWARFDRASLAAAQRRALDYVVSAAEPIAQAASAAAAGGEGPPLAPAPLVDSAAVPDAAIRLLWPGLFGALRADGAGEGLLQLVHAHHRVCSVPADEAADTVSAAIIGHDHVPAGRRIHTRSFVGERIVEDTFLLRGWRGESDDSVAPGDAGTGDPQEDRRWVDTEAHHLGSTTVRSPRHPEQFGLVSGDLNPIHRSNLLARFTGLPGRIVHGMWTSATAQSFLVRDVLAGAVERLRDWRIDFVDMVLPGEPMEITATRVGLCDGDRRVEVMVEGPRGIVARAFATVAPLRTAYVFPGQGIQARGMGMDGFDRSPAARNIWERADRFTRDDLGFSLLDVVRRNPERIRVGGEEHRHPEGVLHLTQFTQVAMATLAAAQVEELRAAGALVPDAVLAGHSVGEYNALASIGGVLPLESVLGIVWARGTAMHHLVARDSTGASEYRLGVVRPHLAGLGADEATALVDSVAEATGELCQVVNHNLRGRQYAVAGTVAALDELQRRLGAGTTPGRAPFLLVPGIDVPFHSAALAAGVADFRRHLDETLPEEIEPAALVGRYVPNLHPVPFSLGRDYVEAVAEVCRGEACEGILQDWDELEANPGRLARELLVELLAWQFASPVRWIETTDVLLEAPECGGLGVERVVEVGLGASPTIANLTSAAVAADRRRGVVVQHVELDQAEVFDSVAEPRPVPAAASGPASGPGSAHPDGPAASRDPAANGAVPNGAVPSGAVPSGAADGDALEEELAADWDGDAPGPAVPGAGVAAAVGAIATGAQGDPSPVRAARYGEAQAVDDLPLSTADAVGALLAHEVQVNLDQLGDDSVDLLVDGASSRRNQVMMDMGKEFGIGAVDGAHEAGRAELSERLGEVARSYRFPGPVLAAAMATGLSAALGPLGAGPGTVEEHLRAVWQLGDGWIDRCRLELFLGTREGASRRGGSLRTLGQPASAVELIEEALAAAAGRVGVALHPPSEVTAGGTVDSVELDALARRVDAAFDAAARAAAEALSGGGEARPSGTPASAISDDQAEQADRLALLDLEHGPERAAAVAPIFDAATIRWFASGISWARADLDHLFHSMMRGTLEESVRERLVERLCGFAGTDDRFDATVDWYQRRAAARGRADAVAAFEAIAAGPLKRLSDTTASLAGRVVLLSGASPGSIAESVAARLLAAGATVVMLTSSSDPRRRRAARELERRHGGPGAQLFLVRANLASFTDVDRLCQWLDSPVGGSGASADVASPGLPDVVLPFAAPRVLGDVPDSGPSTEIELRVLLLGVERLVGGLSERLGSAPGRSTLTAVLPLSPNHGIFGGDGAYGASKAGLEVLIARRRSEHRRWGSRCRIVAAEIGWVRGTGLMSANDELVPIVEQRLGIRTWSSEEMGDAIAALCAPEEGAPDVRRVDLTGGLGDLEDPGSLADLLRQGLPPRASADADGSTELEQAALDALPTPKAPAAVAFAAEWPAPPELAAEEMVVLCGVAEIGPWGSSGTRAEVELHGGLSAGGVLELALRCGLLEWRGTGVGALVDVESGEVVAEHEVAERYRDEVEQRCGIRACDDPYFEGDAPVFIDRSLAIGVGSESEARAVAAGSPGATVEREGDVWTVNLPAGALIRLPRRVELPRRVTAPLPDGIDPTSFGLPVELANAVDPLASWNLATSAEAFRDAGTDPEELLTVVHPAKVADTQGCGMGGMDSLHGLFMDPVRGGSHANDLLQEALPNVPAAHAMQSLLGGYGSMIHPVGACATAAVSLEVALDLVRLGKADVVLAGGYDDLSNVGIIGFADMAATADDAELSARGYDAAEMSRPGDRSRAGFVESAGGGSLVVCRGSVALELGLPVRAVLGLASSHSDGLQRSIPAPGRGALSVGLGGTDSPLGRALRAHGLGPDDIGVLSKHDTSTRANDPNEAAIHERLQELLGRSPGNPLRVISQKSLTGHSKGGAAAWQVAGLCDVFDQAVVPGNRNLDSVDPDVVSGHWLVVDDRALQLCEPPRAALLTSLGFGHVSAVVLLVHPAVFHEALPATERQRWAQRATERRREAARLRRWQPFGGAPAFERRLTRLPGDSDAARAEAERRVLADPAARLGPDGFYPAAAGAPAAAADAGTGADRR